MPTTKNTRIITASVAIGLTVIVAIWLLWGGDRNAEPDPVVAAATDESPAEPPTPEPALKEPDETPSSDFLEAELFYRANVAFAEEEYEQAQIELEALLGLKPDFTAAQDLLDKVMLRLEPPSPAPVAKPKPKPKPKPKRTVRKPPPPPPLTAVEPTGPDPAELFSEAQFALEQGDLVTAEAKLAELRAIDPTYAKAAQLLGDLAHARWMAKLPLAYIAKHDHKLGSCEGTLTLTAEGLGFTSDAHSWSWTFAQLARTERRNADTLRLETRAKKKFNFELRDPIKLVDWAKFRNLAN